MATEVERLVTMLEARITGYERELRKATGQANRSARQIETRFNDMNTRLERGLTAGVQRMTRVLGTFGVAFSAGAFARGARQAVSDVAQLGDLAERLEVSASSLQAWRFAAEESGATAADLDRGLEALTRRLGQFRQSGGGPAAEALRILGLESDVASGRIATSEEAFRRIVQAMEEIPNAADRAGLAGQLFGDRLGPRLATLLGRGEAGMKALEEQARQLGIVLDDEMVRRAKEIERQWERMMSRLSAGWRRFILNIASGGADTDLSALEARAEQLRARLEMPVHMRILFGPESGLRAELDALDREIARRREDIEAGEAMRAAASTTRLTAEQQKALNDALADAVRALEEVERAEQRRRQQIAGTIADMETEVGILSQLRAQYVDSRQSLEQLAISRELLNTAARLGLELGSEEFNQLEALIRRRQQLQAEIDAETERRDHQAARFDRATRDNGEELARTTDMARQFGHVMTSSMDDAIMAGRDLRGVLQGLLLDLARIARQPFMNQLGGFLGNAAMSLFGGGGAAVGGQFAPAFMGGGTGFIGSMFHDGSPGVPAGGKLRRLPRFHNGLGHNEFLSILERGEIVIPRAAAQQVRQAPAPSAPQVDVHTRVINAFDASTVMSEALNSPAGERAILNFVRANSGAVNQALGGRTP